MNAIIVEALGSQAICKLCTEILVSGFDPSNDSLPIQLHTTYGNVLRPDMDIIQKNSEAGCRLCSELLYVFRTKVLNGYEGITQEEDFEKAVEIVVLKYPRLSVDMVFDDEQEPPCYTLVYNFGYAEAGNQDDGEGEIEATDVDELVPDLGSAGGALRIEDPEFDSEAFLQVIFSIMETTCK